MVDERRGRGRGEDSVYFDKLNGYFVAAVSLGYSPDGKRRRRTVRGQSEAEVRRKLRDLHDDIAVNVQAPAYYTVQQAIEDWLQDGLDGRSEATIAKYRNVLKPVSQKIGQAFLRELTPKDVRRALAALAKEHSSATVAIAHNALTRAIRHAESEEMVRRNVSALIAAPRGQAGRPSKAMSPEQARALIATASDLEKHRLGAYVVLCVETGIRTEEARALRWEHVDLDGQPDADPPAPPTMAVWRSVREHGDTKTRLSRRTLALPEHAAEVLREHRRRQDQARSAVGKVWEDNDLVFCTGTGTKLDAANVRRQFKVITKAAGLGQEWTPQELRHTFVSVMSASGVPVEEIAHIAGHSSTRTTEVIYRRELRPVIRRGAQTMDAFLQQKS
jgi:integrase